MLFSFLNSTVLFFSLQSLLKLKEEMMIRAVLDSQVSLVFFFQRYVCAYRLGLSVHNIYHTVFLALVKRIIFLNKVKPINKISPNFTLDSVVIPKIFPVCLKRLFPWRCFFSGKLFPLVYKKSVVLKISFHGVIIGKVPSSLSHIISFCCY